MTTVLLAAGGIIGLVVLFAFALARDSRRRADAWDKWEALFPEEPLPRSDPRVIVLWQKERVP